MAASADKSILSESPQPVQKIPAPEPLTASASHSVAQNAAIRSIDLHGPEGRLEALLNEGREDAPFVTLLCHPHPLGGGTMHNKVVYHAAKVFSSLGWPVLRFNFRGTGLSEGKHHGRHEVEDVTAGLDWLSREYGKPIVAAGFSFGAAIGLEACGRYKSPEGTSEIKGFAALGLPTQAAGRDYTYPFLPSCTFPKLFLSGDHDQFSPVNLLRSVVETAPSPTSFELIPDADHFFVGHLPAMQATLGNWLRTTFLLTAQPEKSQP